MPTFKEYHMNDHWLTAMREKIDNRDFHRQPHDEDDLGLKLLEIGLTEGQCERVMELVYDYTDEPNPKVKRVH
jgi:hypothetical protein